MKTVLSTLLLTLITPAALATDFSHDERTHLSISEQRQALADNTKDKGYGPQSPRDIDLKSGDNQRVFSAAPHYSKMNLCNIHFHESAEHKGGEFTQYAGDGDGKGFNTGYQFAGTLTESEIKPVDYPVCAGKQGSLQPGDTIELHYVHSSAKVEPGPTLGSCVNDAIVNPQLRVEAQVFVVVNDSEAGDFQTYTQHGMINGLHQAINLPSDSGVPVQYEGSTTGPGHNIEASPFKVSWSVRPEVIKVDINSVAEWCKDNVFNEDHAHGVRNLVTNPALLSEIE